MIDVNVSISGIMMCCDDSICSIDLGNGYHIEKCLFDSLPFKDRIIDGRGNLITDYYSSRVIDDEHTFFICIKKQDVFQINAPVFSSDKRVLSAEDFLCVDELEKYMDKEMDYLNEVVNLLRLFKSGNIGFRDVFFQYSFSVMNFIYNTLNHTSHNQTRNIIANGKFSLNKDDVVACNNWIKEYYGLPYELLKKSIEEFSWGLEQVDISTGFEQYTTALEMTLLPKNQPGKKQMLANRISALIGNPPTEVQQLHQKVVSFYRFRSESLHEGDDTNLSIAELRELEDITRKVLRKCLIRCKSEYDLNCGITWSEVKDKIINDLINKVNALKTAGVLSN